VIVASPEAAAQPDLTTGHWSIVEIGGKRLRSLPTINFTRVRWLGLNTSCGPLWGWYRRWGANLRIHLPGGSRYQTGSGSPCQGIDFRLLLGRVRTFTQEGDKFTFLGADGKPIARLMAKK
jgi:hypothetical protein